MPNYQAISGIKSWMPLVKWSIETLRCHNAVCVHISSGFEVMAKIECCVPYSSKKLKAYNVICNLWRSVRSQHVRGTVT